MSDICDGIVGGIKMNYTHFVSVAGLVSNDNGEILLIKNAWLIPGTEDLKPYIPVKVLVRKWIGTVVVYPLIALLMAKIMTFIV